VKESHRQPGQHRHRQTGISGSSITGDYAEWLKDASRKAGDITVVESADTGYWVVQFNGRSDNHYNLAQARHILIKAEASERRHLHRRCQGHRQGQAQKIYDEWLAGDKTEDSFAALAKQYSEDTGSASNGGLYDSIYKGEMVTSSTTSASPPDARPATPASSTARAAASSSPSMPATMWSTMWA
jgi:hypothetical protein